MFRGAASQPEVCDNSEARYRRGTLQFPSVQEVLPGKEGVTKQSCSMSDRAARRDSVTPLVPNDPSRVTVFQTNLLPTKIYYEKLAFTSMFSSPTSPYAILLPTSCTWVAPLVD